MADNYWTGGVGRVWEVTKSPEGRPNKANFSTDINYLYPKPLREKWKR